MAAVRADVDAVLEERKRIDLTSNDCGD